jgi:hypothetical protein
VSASARLLHWLEDTSDRLSPLVVKEVRQVVRGREFTLSFASSLLVGLAVAFFGAASALGGSSTAGRWTFLVLLGGLALLGLAVVPLGAFSALRHERLEQTLELITLTALSPRRIVIGKLMAQAVKLATLFAAIAPFLAMSFLLGGIDFTSILVSLIVLFLASVWVCALFLVMSATSKSRVLSVLLFGAIGLAAILAVPLAGSLVRAASRGVFVVPSGILGMSAVPWWSIGLAGTLWLASLVNLVLLAENRLSPPAEDAVTPLRLGLFVQFLLMVAWALTCLWDPTSSRRAAAEVLAIAGALQLAVVAAFAVTEDLAISRRARRRMQTASRMRWLIARFGPGAGRAAFYLLVQMTLLIAAVWVLAPSASTGGWVAAACGYICFFTGIPVLAFRLIAPGRVTPLRLRVTVLVAVASSLVLPDFIHYLVWQRDILDVAFSFRHLVNPFRTLADWRVVESRGWLAMPFAIGLTGVVAWLVLIQMGARADGPSERVDPRRPATVAGDMGRGDVLY